MPRNSQNGQIERRFFTLQGGLEARTSAEKRTLAGHAAIFDAPTDLGPYKEVVAPGAFTDTIKEDDIRALFNHDPNYVLGRNAAGTLRLAQDKQGLAIEIDPPDTQYARDLAVSISRGDITQMSFGFQPLETEWLEADGVWQRTLVKVKLWDVSPVTFPAYAETDIGMRSLEAYRAKIVSPRISTLRMLRQKQIEASL